MENATDALKMAFAIFTFVICLSLAFSMITKAKETADTVLWYSDKTNYMLDYTNGEQLKGARIVGRDSVISALYKARKETTVTVRIDLGDGTTIEYSSASEDSIEFNGKSGIEGIVSEKLRGYEKAKFSERIEEITIAGTYKIADDGTKIVVSTEGISNPTRIYITYTLLN